jgi:GTP-dependent dephospho-CoA kinase
VLILKKELRSEFKKPFGKIYPSVIDAKEHLKDSLGKNGIVISIGDVTTQNMLNASMVPDIGIVDNKIERRVSENEIRYEDITLKAENPAGTITDDLQSSIEKAFSSVEKGKVLIVVEGEEDLAVIPCVIMAPSGSVIFYGQPGEGVVLCEVDKVKKTAEDLIKRLEEA